ncbi:MAG: glycosyltransferase family 4 protein [Candidatus Moranbacteria bacterium]|nr:glycosyltransferase family 4 protein [Candidatus Moranbacteria bacterium]
MNIAIQASDLDAQRIDGTRVYLKNLLDRFGALAPETKFLLFHKDVFNPALLPPERSNYRPVSIPFPFSWMQTRFAFEIFRVKPNKLFLPIQASPIFIPKEVEVTATIHDLAFKKYPETFPKSHRAKLDFLLRTVLCRADKLIAVSASTRKDILEYFPNILPEKVRVIHHGFDAKFFSKKFSEGELKEMLSRYRLHPKGYILYVGALQPRKNLIRLIEAFTLAKQSGSQEMKLVLAGEAAWLSEGIFGAREKSSYRDDIIFTDRVSFDDLRVLYQGAKLFAFPSLYEGFGLPILEAFASGVPVLTADNSSLPEVGGNAALYCQAKNVLDIAEKLKQLWGDEMLRAELVKRGSERLQYFSWERCAQETLGCIFDSTH